MLLKCSNDSRSLQFLHRVKMPWCPHPLKTEAYGPELIQRRKIVFVPACFKFSHIKIQAQAIVYHWVRQAFQSYPSLNNLVYSDMGVQKMEGFGPHSQMLWLTMTKLLTTKMPLHPSGQALSIFCFQWAKYTFNGQIPFSSAWRFSYMNIWRKPKCLLRNVV